MSVNVSIKLSNQKQTLQIQDVLFQGMRYGIMDAAYRLSENETGEVMVIFNTGYLGRGYEITLPQGAIELRLPIPTGDTDIRFFYAYLQKLCQKFSTTDFWREDEKGSFAAIADYIKEDIGLSEQTLRVMEADIDAGKYNSMYLFGVLNPIAIGKADLREIDGSLSKLAAFFQRHQAMDVYYAKPNVYQRKDETLFGVYALPENVPAVFPKQPGLFMGPKDMQIDNWYVGFVINDDLAGTVSYADFLANTKPSAAYDVEHFIISLNKRQMTKLLSFHGAQP